MLIEELPLSSVKPYEKNPRKNEEAVAGVAESIKQFGFQQPIVIDKDGVIVAGHTRYKAAKRLGLKTVPCVRASALSPEQIKAYRILDNKLNEKATWDFETLSEELQSFKFNFDEFKVDFPKFDFKFESSDTDDTIESSEDNRKKTAIQKLRDNVANLEPELAIYVICRSEQDQEELYNFLVEKGYDAKCVRT